MKRTFAIVVFLGVAAVFAVLTLGAGANAKPQVSSQTTPSKSTPPKVPPTVRVEAVGTVSSSQPKNYVGTVSGKEWVQIVPRVTGFLERVAFREGAMVTEGDLLFEIEDAVYEINVRATESVVRQIEAELALARKELERMETLRRDRVVSEHEYDVVLRTVVLQEAKRDEARANLDRARNDLSHTKIVAPLTGRIGAKQYSEGNYLRADAGILATIVQTDPVRVAFSMSEADAMNFRRPDGELKDVKIEIVRANGEPFRSPFKVDFLDTQIDRQTGTLAVFLECDNRDLELIPGGYVKIGLAEQFAEPRLAVPITALMIDGGQHIVYVIGNDQRVERRSVEIDQQVFDKQVIRAGLVLGERVIVGGINKVAPGDEVRIP